MPNKVRTIFMVIHSGFGARYLLRSDIFKVLKSAGIRIVILTPNADEAYFRAEFEDDRVIVEQLEIEKCREYRYASKIQSILQEIRQLTFSGGIDVSTLQEKLRVYRERSDAQTPKRKLLLALILFSTRVLSVSKWARQLLIWLESFFFSGHFHRHLFEKYRPDLVLLTSLGYWHPDDFLMREARYHGALVVPVILSWDNTSSKGMAGAQFDQVIAWTEVMKSELIAYHDVDPAKIFVGGIAHFDIHRRPQNLLSRPDFFRQVGLNPDHKTIVFATKSPNAYPWNADITRLLAEAIATGQFAEPCQLIIRLHPIYFRYKDGELLFQDQLDEYNAILAAYPFVKLDFPAILSEVLSLDMPASDMIWLGSMLLHADVLVNLFSTVAIEASIYDLPTIHVAFEGHPAKKNSPRHEIRIDEFEIHNQRVIQTGGVRLAYSTSELVGLVNMYLQDRSMDAAERQIIEQQECGPNPGKAGQTIANHILTLLTAESQ